MHVPVPVTVPSRPLVGLSESLSFPIDPLTIELDPTSH